MHVDTTAHFSIYILVIAFCIQYFDTVGLEIGMASYNGKKVLIGLQMCLEDW